MHRCLLLLAEGHDHPIPDDELVVMPLYERGWQVECASWRQKIKWDNYNVVLIRSTWDYHEYPTDFLEVMREIDASEACLLNDLTLIEWNVNKKYLAELENWGVPIIPTVWRDRLEAGGLKSLFEEVGGSDLVVKPVVGASAADTYRVTEATLGPMSTWVESTFEDRALMAQPLATRVLDQGEYSLFYFEGAYSHAVLKRARRGDFRVQAEYGGSVAPWEPSRELRELGAHVVSVLPHPSLYARIDAVETNDGRGLWLMEAELIEPELFLRTDAGAPGRFADAVARRVDPGPVSR